MARNKIAVTKKQGALGRKAQNTDNVIGIIAGGVAVSGTLVLNQTYICNSINDVTALGITAAYDVANIVLLYRRLERIYTRNPSAEVHLMVVARTITLTQMVDIGYTTAFGRLLIQSANGRIKYLGIMRNPATYAPTLTDGIDADVLTAIPKAQELYDEQSGLFRPCQIVIEGRAFDGTSGDAPNFRDLAADYPNVSVVCVQDPNMANKTEDVDDLFTLCAQVEDFMALKTIGAVSQNVGENNVELFNLQDVAAGYYIGDNNIYKCVALSSGIKVASYTEADLAALHNKGFIFGEPLPGLKGIYFNDTHTCCAITSDFAYVENNAVIDKAISLARPALLPKVNARLLADETTGQLTPIEEKGLIQIAIDSLNIMQLEGDISGGINAQINPDNPDYDLLAGDDLNVELTFIPVIIGRSISLTVGFRNPKKSN